MGKVRRLYLGDNASDGSILGSAQSIVWLTSAVMPSAALFLLLLRVGVSISKLGSCSCIIFDQTIGCAKSLLGHASVYHMCIIGDERYLGDVNLWCLAKHARENSYLPPNDGNFLFS